MLDLALAIFLISEKALRMDESYLLGSVGAMVNECCR